MKIKLIPIFILITVFLFSCSKESSEPQASLADLTSPEKLKEKAEALKAKEAELLAASIPRGDKSKSLDTYKEMDSGKQALFAYYAVVEKDIDYAEVATKASSKYSLESDGFKKQDMLAEMKPELASGISEAAKNKYYFIKNEDGGQLAKYDFERKSFFVNGFKRSDTYMYWRDGGAKLAYSNSKDFQWLHVEDEVLARKIEKMIVGYKDIYSNIYFYAGNIDKDGYMLRGEIMAVRFFDGSGNFIAEIK